MRLWFPMFTRRRLALIALLLLPATASADPISFRFTGTVRALSPTGIKGLPWFGPAAVGDPFTGFATLETAATDLDESAGQQLFFTPVFRLDVQFPNAAVFNASDFASVVTTDCFDELSCPSTFDVSDRVAFNFNLPADPFNRGVSLFFTTLPGQRDIVSIPAGIPTDPSFLLQFPQRLLVLSAVNDMIEGDIETLELVTPKPVPEPGTLLLFASGVVVAVRRGATRTPRKGHPAVGRSTTPPRTCSVRWLRATLLSRR